MSIKVMKQALDALESASKIMDATAQERQDQAIAALRQAIKQAENKTSTHSASCWRWHHECAVAKIERAEKQKPVADDERVDALRTLSYCAGLKAGWNFCAADDHDGLERAQAATSEAMRVLRTTSPQREPLTDEQIAKIASTPCAVVGSYVHTFARAIEAAHGIGSQP